MTSPVELISTFWGLKGAALTPLDGGINSDTWLVEHQESTYVAKRVPATSVAELVTGCEVALQLADAGFVTGRPVPTTDDRLLLIDHGLALFEFVPGRELVGETDEDQHVMGETLARIHAAGDPARGPSSAAFMADWLAPDSPWLTHHAWLVRAIESVRADTDSVTLTWSVLHTDPAPEAFVHDDSTGVTGLIDWAGSQRGPILYDVASAVMYLGGTEQAAAFLSAYRSNAPFVAEEIQHLSSFRRFRETVQGAYFARRLAAGDLTGGIGEAENQQGLSDAQRRLAALGFDPA